MLARKKTVFQKLRKDFFHLPGRSDFVLKEKTFDASWKKIILLVWIKKKNFQTKNFLYLSEKLISYASVRKLKCFISDVFGIGIS